MERDTVGGTVVTSGGAPTKTFREAAAYLSSFEKKEVWMGSRWPRRRR